MNQRLWSLRYFMGPTPLLQDQAVWDEAEARYAVAEDGVWPLGAIMPVHDKPLCSLAVDTERTDIPDVAFEAWNTIHRELAPYVRY